MYETFLFTGLMESDLFKIRYDEIGAGCSELQWDAVGCSGLSVHGMGSVGAHCEALLTVNV